MIRFESDCVGCPPEMGCLGISCPHHTSVHLICDECEEEVDEGELYEYGDQQLCMECAIEHMKEDLKPVDVEAYAMSTEE